MPLDVNYSGTKDFAKPGSGRIQMMAAPLMEFGSGLFLVCFRCKVRDKSQG